MTTCPKCNGLGSISEGSGFHNAGETPPVSITCDECSGTGQVPPRFFVEFIFEYDLTGRKYWLPLFILTDDSVKANKITLSTKKALEEQFQNIEHTAPIPEVDFNKQHIQHRNNFYKTQKTAILNVEVWEITDINPNPNWSFNQHMDFIAENRPLTERNLTTLVDGFKFPVRVIKEAQFPIDFKEFLLINVVKQ